MKLRNKKTGEIVDGGFVLAYYDGIAGNPQHSLAELNEEWEDYEEQKGNWTIDPMNENYIDDGRYTAPDELERYEELGLKFNTKEEAEEAVEKLKAFKRLKDVGFRFIDWELDMKTVADGKIWFDIGTNTEWDAERLLELKPEVKESLDILFGGEE